MPQKLVRIWHTSSKLSIGEITRYRIRFNQSNDNRLPPIHNLVIKISNKTPLIYRGAILSGPYNFSASVILTSHIKQQGIIPQCKPSISCGESWKSNLKVSSNGIEDWTIEIVSEILFSVIKVK